METKLLGNIEGNTIDSRVPVGELVSRFECLTSGALPRFCHPLVPGIVTRPESLTADDKSELQPAERESEQTSPPSPLDIKDWEDQYAKAYRANQQKDN